MPFDPKLFEWCTYHSVPHEVIWRSSEIYEHDKVRGWGSKIIPIRGYEVRFGVNFGFGTVAHVCIASSHPLQLYRI